MIRIFFHDPQRIEETMRETLLMSEEALCQVVG